MISLACVSASTPSRAFWTEMSMQLRHAILRGQTDANGGTDLDLLAARASHDVIPTHGRVRKYSLAGLAALVIHAETLEDIVVGDPCTASRPEDGRFEAVGVGPSEEVGVNTANNGVYAVEIVIVDCHAEVADHSSEGAGGPEA